MLNQYPLWKYIMLITVLVIGSIYSLPNLYGEDPSVQISHKSKILNEDDRINVEQLLTTASITFSSTELTNGRLLVRFSDVSIQGAAADTLKDTLDNNHYVALNLAPATPDWLRSLAAAPMYLGLDLRGARRLSRCLLRPARPCRTPVSGPCTASTRSGAPRGAAVEGLQLGLRRLSGTCGSLRPNAG